ETVKLTLEEVALPRSTRDDHALHAGARESRHLVGDERAPRHVDQRLRPPTGSVAEPLGLAAGEDDRLQAATPRPGGRARPSPASATGRVASTIDGASRMSSVSGLNASPSRATFLPRSEPRWRFSFPITRRFCSSFTSITAESSWKW